jgi:hypothetical protein
MIPEEMHDKIIQDQMRNANDERRKSIKKEGKGYRCGRVMCGCRLNQETCTG